MSVAEGTKVTVSFTELDLQIMLEALGTKQNQCYDKGMNSKAVQIVIEKIYRAMGVHL